MSDVCTECDRPRPTVPPILINVVASCAECGAAFSIDELATIFREANRRDTNAARVMRQEIVDGLLAALKRKEH